MKPLFDDTSPEVEAMLIEGYRNMAPLKKLKRVIALNRAVEQLATARLKTTYGGDMTEHQLRLRLASLRLDRETMIRVFNWDPEVEGYDSVDLEYFRIMVERMDRYELLFHICTDSGEL